MTQGFILIILFGFLVFDVCFGALVNNDEDPNKGLNAMQIIRKYGYPGEAFTVETKDGYLLEMHRIPYGRNGKKESSEKTPILIQHGLLCSSADFVLLGPESSLPFILADMGFDVWMGNARGNTYSRAHAFLDPSHNKFWNFTWHESGIYDLPAMIDFVLGNTCQEKLVFIGHSMGTTMYFVLMSMLPEYNEKIEAGFMLAPVAYLGHQESPLLKAVVPISEEFQALSQILGHGEFLSNTRLFTFISRLVCGGEVDSEICLNIIYMLVGDDPREYDKEVMDMFINHFPEGYSTKAIEHYAQLIKSNEFLLYSYGRRGNMRQYGQPRPPIYNLQNIRTPMYLYVGKNDYLANVMDVDRLATQLYDLKEYFLVDYCKFSHLDFLVGKNVRSQLYDHLIDDIVEHLSGEETRRVAKRTTWASTSNVTACNNKKRSTNVRVPTRSMQRELLKMYGYPIPQRSTMIRTYNDVPLLG